MEKQETHCNPLGTQDWPIWTQDWFQPNWSPWPSTTEPPGSLGKTEKDKFCKQQYIEVSRVNSNWFLFSLDAALNWKTFKYEVSGLLQTADGYSDGTMDVLADPPSRQKIENYGNSNVKGVVN